MLTRRTAIISGSAVVAAVLATTLVGSGPDAPAPAVGVAVVDTGIAPAAVEAPVIVQARPGRVEQARRAAVEAGARIEAPLPIVHGFAARLSGTAAATLATSPDVVAVTLDRPGAFQSDAGTAGSSSSASTSAFAAASGASAAWNKGLRGTGVTVAVLDTGISPTADLASRVIPGPDLSGEGTPIDSYGHGTVMAGIIGGNGRDSGGRRSGIAPESRLVSVKVAGRNGAVDVSTVLQGMSWISAYRDHLGIRVLNLSYGTRSTQDPAIDPLNFAVQRLWSEGIVVVVAAGNSGPGPGTITKPGDDPVVLTVGAYDDRGDASPRNDSVPAWSSLGPTAQGVAKPDLVAPGRTVVASRSYGSAVEEQNPKSLVTPSYIKGSGTSQAAAVTSGLAALVLQARPTWTPDQVKQALTTSALPLLTTSSTTTAGRPHVLNAIRADPGLPHRQSITATGLGSIEASRGGVHVTTACGLIQGEIDAVCSSWDPVAFTGNSWSGNSWSGNSWSGNSWSGNSWSGNSWSGNSWSGNSWSGNSWSGNSWSGNSWSGNSWSGNSWSTDSWTSSTSSEATRSSQPSRLDGRHGTLTAFWGDRPARGMHVAGEQATS